MSHSTRRHKDGRREVGRYRRRRRAGPEPTRCGPANLRTSRTGNRNMSRTHGPPVWRAVILVVPNTFGSQRQLRCAAVVSIHWPDIRASPPAGHPFGAFQPGFSPDVASIDLRNDVRFDCLPTDHTGARRRGDRHKSSGRLRRRHKLAGQRQRMNFAERGQIPQQAVDPALDCVPARGIANTSSRRPKDASANPPPRRSPTPTTFTSSSTITAGASSWRQANPATTASTPN